MPVQKLRPSFTFDQDRLNELRAVVPEAFADGKLNWAVLREALGDHLENADEEIERFGLFWPGKREARRLASVPSQGTLVPEPGLGVSEDTTQNIFIEGENLEVLKLLQKSYAGRVKMIYIDPPYNTGNDFIYSDDYSEPLESYLQRTGQADEEGKLVTTNTRASGRFHSNWLSMMYPRLRLARQLLRDDGVIFVSIDDNEVHNLRHLMNEVFGEEKFIAQFVWKSRQNKDNRSVTRASIDHEYVLCYGDRIRGDDRDASRYTNPDGDPRGPWTSANMVGLLPEEERPNCHYDLVDPGTGINYGKPEMGWRYDQTTMNRLIREDKILWPDSPDGRPRRKVFLSELQREFTGYTSTIGQDIYTHHGTAEIEQLFGRRVIQFPKPTELIKELVQQGSGPEEEGIVLDFFSGSSTTAHAVLELNREAGGNLRFIMVQIPEPIDDSNYHTVVDIGRERIRRVIRQMTDDTEDQLSIYPDENLGFKCYSLYRSNYKPWEDITTPDSRQIEMAFDRFETPLVEGWERADLFAEVLLMEGFPLDSTVTRQQQFRHNQVDLVTSDFHEHRLFVCLDETIVPQTMGQLALADKDVFVCLDAALSDEAKVRLSDTGNIHVI